MENRNRLQPSLNTNANCYNQPLDLAPKITISINISKTNYIIFYDKKKLPPPSSILVSINENLLTKFKAKGVVGIIIDEDLTFTLHIEHILSPHLTFQL